MTAGRAACGLACRTTTEEYDGKCKERKLFKAKKCRDFIQTIRD